jgi:hypothetical protein
VSIDVEEVAVRTGTTTDWAAATAPVLAAGEVGIDLTTREVRVGDGTNAFPDLGGIGPALVSVTLVAGTKATADAKIKTSSRIVPVVVALGTVTAPKEQRVTKTAGTGFTITSADATDTSTLDVLIWH